MIQQYYSKGKLLITGEYFVLEGAKAFALPLNLGQSLKVEYLEDSQNQLIWETNLKYNPWFKAKFSIKDLSIIETSEYEKAKYIQKLLVQIKKMSNVLGENTLSIKITTNLEFSTDWGLGSSSSLISNLSYWAKINPYDLLFNTNQGSGFDIACARSDGPIIYQLKEEPEIANMDFDPDFLDQIYFIYLGRKQNSLKSVLKYREIIKKNKKLSEIISNLTLSVIQSKSLEEFEYYIDEHEMIISETIKETRVKQKYFKDYDGAIKSLGTWGGDFILATNNNDSMYVENYFKDKGMNIIFPYKNLVLCKNYHTHTSI